MVPNGAAGDGRGSSHFPVTRWSLVGRAATRGTENGRLALAELLQIYLPALRGYLTLSLRIDEHRADDLLQGFLADKVLQQDMLGQADRERGKFRSFLLTALKRFVIDEFRRDTTQQRSPVGAMRDINDYAARIESAQNPSDIFDRIWAEEVLGEVMRRMRDELSDDLPTWSIFESRILLPITDGAAAPSHEDLARRFSLSSASHASNLLGTAKRMFRRIFRGVVAEYTAEENDIDAEIDDLWNIFRTPAA
jgi:RNA polymerase sigma-70 factor (ECF subfamily)